MALLTDLDDLQEQDEGDDGWQTVQKKPAKQHHKVHMSPRVCNWFSICLEVRTALSFLFKYSCSFLVYRIQQNYAVRLNAKLLN